MQRNYRRHPRVTCAAPVDVEGPKGSIRGYCRNLSQGGMFFVGAELPIGKTLQFWLELPNGKVTILGEVRYSHVYPEGEGFGVRFTRLTHISLGLLNGFIATAPGGA